MPPRGALASSVPAQGWADKESGFAPEMSERTAINHVSSIFAKTGAGNRVEAARFAGMAGLAPETPPPAAPLRAE